MSTIQEQPFAKRCFRLVLAALLHGVGTGVIGIFVATLIAYVQDLGFGESDRSFYYTSSAAPPWRRMLSVTVGGVFGAICWFWLRGLETTFVPVEDCLKGAWMPPGVTVVNGMIQDIVVALGGSFGREAAPREIAAMWASVLCRALGVPAAERKVLVACGAGAGLAAVYSVPVSGAIYTIEHVLHWDISPMAIVLAIVTCGLATLVTSPFVATDGLYHMMPNFSYIDGPIASWTDELLLLLWAVPIGLLAGVLAACFRGLTKLVQTLQPEGRIPVTFEDARVGLPVWFTRNRDGQEVHERATILDIQGERCTVRFDGELEDDELSLFMWYEMDPRGGRGWHILVAMPAAFLLLGMLAFSFPCLLGNGRALAMAAFYRDRSGLQLWALFFMKALVTLAAIGSGAAGGTLTPAVALGATLGVTFGEFWNNFLPLPNSDVQAMGLISAASFLAASTRCPLASVCLLIEFAAQGIKREHIIQALCGDTSGLLQSRFTLPILMPMAIAALVSTCTEFAVQQFIELAKKGKDQDSELSRALVTTPSSRTLSRRRSTKALTDIPIDYEEDLPLDDRMVDLSYRGFRIGIALNTCLTLGFASAAPSQHLRTTIISSAGLGCACLAGIGLGLRVEWRVTRKNLDFASNTSSSRSSRGRAKERCAHRAMSVVCVAFFSILGAIPPFLPWALEVWRDPGGGLTALVVSIFSVVVVSAFSALLDALDPKHGYIRVRPHQQKRQKAVLKQALGTLILSMIACGAGALASFGLSKWHDLISA